jgi:hypothetical protein
MCCVSLLNRLDAARKRLNSSVSSQPRRLDASQRVRATPAVRLALLLWVYYCAQIFLLGAEFTKVYAHSRE